MRNFTLRNALILSFALHVMVTAFLALSQLRPTPPVVETVTVDFIDAREKNAADPTPKTKHIVDMAEKSANDEKPVKEAYLSAHDQRVEKETAARERGEFRNLKNAARRTSRPAGETAEKPVAKNRPTLRDLTGNNPVNQLQEREQKRFGEKGAGQAASDSSRTNDYLKNVESGAETMLNTREFKYFTYYSRIRRQLSQYWEPTVKVKLNKMFKQGRRIASDQDHITKLLIVLNEKGNLVRVQVMNESGVADLDDAAMEAFRSAAPFPNPPKGIIEADGTVKIRWDFILES
ncbi:MAG: TonB family protein [Bdellovibrionaceae bacterium]|nr:TonB family protein [Pseudobdellovibrionaceae bacterium]